MAYLNPRVDLAFKKIFGSIENKDLLISFINSIVSEEDQVADLELLNPYNPKQFHQDKLSILDIKAKDTNGNYYNIEVQISDEADYDKRALYYWAKLYGEQLQSGMGYSELRKAVGIHVLNFTSIPDNPKYINKFVITNEETQKRHFKDLELYTIELSKFTSGDKESLDSILPKIKNGLDRWVTFLTKAYCIDLHRLPKELDDPCIKKAMDVLSIIHLNKEEKDLYDGQLKWLRIEASTLDKAKSESRAEGKAEGRIEGKTEAIIEMARKLLKENVPISIIQSATGLSEEKIRSL